MQHHFYIWWRASLPLQQTNSTGALHLQLGEDAIVEPLAQPLDVPLVSLHFLGCNVACCTQACKQYTRSVA